MTNRRKDFPDKSCGKEFYLGESMSFQIIPKQSRSMQINYKINPNKSDPFGFNPRL